MCSFDRGRTLCLCYVGFRVAAVDGDGAEGGGMMGRLNRLFKSAAVGVVLLALPASVSAQGFYIGGAGGYNMPRDSEIEGGGTSVDADLDNGFAGALGVGYAYRNGIRTEIELSYRGPGDVDNIGSNNGMGDVTAWGAMLNLLYDFNRGGFISPYIGGGIGLARVRADNAGPALGTTIDDSDNAFAYQGIAGLSHPITDRLSLDLSYRYFGVPSLDFTAANGAAVDSEYHSHAIMIGLRFSFGGPAKKMEPKPAAMPKPMPAPMAQAPRPAPAPQPAAPPVPRNYIVFFDWDSDAITTQASGILDSAAANAQKVGPVRIQLSGHADRSGTVRYNQGLSQRRADNVKAALVQRGVSAGEISVQALGETQPLVPTADGVREPQNRRVEIVFQ